MNMDFEIRKCLFYVSNILSNTKYIQNNLKDVAEWIIDQADKYCNYSLMPEVADASRSDFMEFAKKHQLKAVKRIKEFAVKLQQKSAITRRIKLSIFEKNLIYVQNLFDLSEEEKEFLGFMVRQKCDVYLSDILGDLKYRSSDLTIEEYAVSVGLSRNEVFKLCSSCSRLINLGLLEFEYDGTIAATTFAQFFYYNKFSSVDDIKRHILGNSLTAMLKWEDFSHIRQIEVLKRILVSSLKTKEKGVNILLYGEPGTGKTEFSKTLAENVNAMLFAIGDSNNTVLEKDDSSRYKQLLRANFLLKNEPNSCLLVDEADDILGTCYATGFRYCKQDEEISKIKVNRLLENNERPTIWVSNNICCMDKAYLRRFTYAVNFTKPDRATIQTMWQKSLKENKFPYDEKTAAEFAKKYSLSPSFISTATKSTHLISGGLTEVMQVLDVLQEAYNNGNKRKVETERCGVRFNPFLLNTDTDLQKLAERIVGLKRFDFSLCLYGASGTGKSAFAQYLGEKLQIPVIKKGCSDLLSMWVGQSEQNIADAFAEAEQRGALLVFDEADSFLRDRSGADHSWEITQVNEMLTQMEKHPYPFVCTTNLMDTLDKASLRRFTFKVKYDYLTEKQRTLCFEHFFGIRGVCLDDLTTLTPGDFVVVKNKAEILGCLDNQQELVNMLMQEQQNKVPVSKKIGFI